MNAAGDAVVAWPGGTTIARTGGQGRGSRPAAAAFSAPAEVSAVSPDFLHPEAAIDGDGNATVVWSRSDGANRSPRRPATTPAPPEMRGLSIPATGTVGVPVSFSAVAVRRLADRLDPASPSATGPAAPGTSVSHAYSAPGIYQVTATAVGRGRDAGLGRRGDRDLAVLRVQDRQAEAEHEEGDGDADRRRLGPGTGRGLRQEGEGKSKRAAGAGSVTLAIAAKGKALKQLKKKGKAKVRVTVTFTRRRRRPRRHERGLGHAEEAS